MISRPLPFWTGTLPTERSLIDFRLRHGFRNGLSIDIVASDSTEIPRRSGRAINIREDAYLVLEVCIIRHWPQYRPYGRYGVSHIPSAVWIKILASLTRVRASIESARRPATINLPGVNSEAWSRYKTRLFRQKAEAVRMIDLLTFRIARLRHGHKFMVVCGI